MRVPNKKQEAVRNINCPKCKNPLFISFIPDSSICQTNNETQDNNADTIYINQEGVKAHSGYLDIEGVRYDITKDISIIGRKASTSKADIQIATNDMYMGRQHAVITRNNGALEGTLFTIRDYQSKNGLTVDGIQVGGNIETPIVNGSRIKMGNTTIIFKTT